MERKVFPKYDKHAGNWWSNLKLLSFAQAVQARLPLIGDTLRAELRAAPGVKKSLSVMAQLGAVHEIEQAVKTGTDGEPETVNRLIKLGLQQEERPEVFEKIRETRRAIENPPPERKPRPGRAFAQATLACLPLIGDTLRAGPGTAPGVAAELETVREIERAVRAGTGGEPETVKRLIKLGMQQEKRPEVFEKIRETRRAIENENPPPERKPQRARARSL